MASKTLSNPALATAISNARGSYSGDLASYSSVMNKTMLQFAIVLPVAIAVGLLTPPASLSMVAIVSSLAALVISFIVSMQRKVNIPMIIVYDVVEGAFVGALTALYGYMFNGAVMTAIVATTVTTAVIILGERSGVFKTSARSRKIFGYMVIGYIVFSLIVLAAALLGHPILRFGSPISIIVSLFGVGMASFSLLSNVEDVDRAVNSGMSDKEGWRVAFGLVVSLVWLYVEMLRLVGNLMSLNR